MSLCVHSTWQRARETASGHQQAVGVAGASMMDANRAPRLRVTRTPSRTVDETTLPRMTGDAGLLMSITTSASEDIAAT
jgi:hypothetical protein